MRDFLRRTWLGVGVAVIATGAMVAAPASATATEPSFGVQEFVSATCKNTTCTEPFTQAAAHPPVGLTLFKMNAVGAEGEEAPAGGVLKNLRIDLPAGLSINPDAVPYCSMEAFEGHELQPGVFTESTCEASTVLGVNKVVVVVEPAEGVFADVTLLGTVYNLVQPEGVPAEFGVALDLEPLGATYKGSPLYAHTLIEGGVSWHPETGLSGEPVPRSGDYHEYFKISNIGQAPPLLESTLIYNGMAGAGFITTPSTCDGPLTTYMEAQSSAGEVAKTQFPTPLGVTGCSEVPFSPKIKVEPSSTQSDQPDGATVRVEVPQNANPEAVDSSTLSEAKITLPEGMTLNPAAADGLEACTDQQFGRGTANPVTCPAGSQIGTVTIETPTLPAGSLAGNVYLGQPVAGAKPNSGHMYRIFIDAESARYGVAVRLEGRVIANEQTGQLTTVVPENPPTPFSDFIVRLNAGAHTPLANPLACGAAQTTSVLTPYTGLAAALPTDAFTVDANGKGGACPAPLPFNIAQTTAALPTAGGAATAFTLTLAREDGQQYLSQVSTALPEGLLAKIPAVPLCDEAAAQQGSCPAASRIGTAAVAIGSGASPYPLGGAVYLTGPYAGAPYGLSVVVNAEKVGPFDYGLIVTRAKIEIDPYSARVTIASTLPTIVGGAPIRLRSLTISIDHAGFMVNPTSCAVLSTDSTLTSTFGATATVSSPFQATGCSALAFKPSFKAFSNAKTSRKLGANLKVAIKQAPGEANIGSVAVTLPKLLPSRESTLEQACPAATFEANPYSCPLGSRVGGATVTTPTLPGKLTGPAYFVSHGGIAFPDLDLVLSGDGVRVILVGHTNIKGGITHSKFTSLPDVPISSFNMKLPIGSHSALAAPSGLCRHRIYMPTVIVGQNGAKVTQKTRIRVAHCPIEIIHHKLARHHARITVMTPSAGKVITSGKYLQKVHKKVGTARRVDIKAKLDRRGRRLLHARHHLKVRVHVRFIPAASHRKHHHASKKALKLTFRR